MVLVPSLLPQSRKFLKIQKSSVWGLNTCCCHASQRPLSVLTPFPSHPVAIPATLPRQKPVPVATSAIITPQTLVYTTLLATTIPKTPVHTTHTATTIPKTLVYTTHAATIPPKTLVHTTLLATYTLKP